MRRKHLMEVPDDGTEKYGFEYGGSARIEKKLFFIFKK